MRLEFAGTPATALPSLDAISASCHDVVAVVTRPASAQGRSARPVPSPVARWAEEHDVEVLMPDHPKELAFRERLSALAPDCCPVVAYGAFLPQRTLDIPLHGWVNLHFSLLPAYRGAAPVQRALMDGVATTGATTFQIVRELDAGPVYGTVTEPVAPLDTAGDLLDRLAVSGAGLLVETLDRIAAGAEPTPQPDEGITYAAKLELADLLAERRVVPRDAAFATELAYGTLRLEGTYDQILVAASGRTLDTLQPAVVDVLRLGAHQILGMRVPVHAAVGATVDLAAAAIGERVTGVVNAVLRKVAQRDMDG